MPLSVGAVLSWTSTVKLALPVLPAASVAEHVTVVTPGAKVPPEEGLQLAVTVPSTASVPEAL